jgi:probable F420-dependent oxidoreductase
VKVDAGLMLQQLAAVPARVRELERAGYDGVATAEIANDPFLPLVLAAEHSERLELSTSIAVAFARNPMLLAQTAHDLNAWSRGRMILGLGSQIRAHIARRFSMPWSRPAARMREFIQAMQAIWGCWYEGKELAFRGEFYTHTLMTPMFTPAERSFGAPRVFLAAVGPRMSEVAGEVADGLIAHGFTTDRYFREVTLPAVLRGLAASGRARDSFAIQCPVFVASGENEEELRSACDRVRAQIAFYGSTPAYRGVLELHGWGALQDELNRLSKQGRWAEMGGLVDDEMLHAFAVVGPWEDVLRGLRARASAGIDRLLCTFDLGSGEAAAERLAALRR